MPEALAQGGKPQKRIVVYDFRRPDKFSKEQIRTVQVMHETFARLSTTTLSASMRALVNVRVAGVDQMTYDEFIRSIPSPTMMAILSMAPLKGNAVLEIDPSISYAIIDRLFGGSGEGSYPRREHTDIEHSALEGIIVRIFGNLREAWSTVIDLKPRLYALETNPQFAQIVPPSEMIILVSLEATVGDSTGMLNLAFPYLTIEPIIPKLSAQYWYSSPRPSTEPATVMLEHIEDFGVAAELLVEGDALSLRAIGALKKGSLVRVPGAEAGEATFRMGGRSLFRMKALPRKKERSQSYQIIEHPSASRLAFVEQRGSEGQGPELGESIGASLRELRSGMDSALSGIAGSIAALRRKHDELTDQLTLGTAVRGDTEAATRERKRPFAFLSRADLDHLLALIQVEHSQTIALVLSYLEPQAASRLLGALSPELHPDVAKRIARMNPTMPEVLGEVERVLEKKLSVIASDDFAAAGGLDRVVDILTLADRSTERFIVDSLASGDPGLAEDIKKRMFVFEDIVMLDRSAVAGIVRRVEPELLLRALKAAPEDVRDLIWSCMPKGELEGLKARFEALGKVRLREVDAAQAKIVAAIREMVEAGEITIVRPGDEAE